MVATVFPDFSVIPLPRVIRIEPSSACNLRCIHCPTGTRKGLKRGVMSKSVYKKIVSELKNNKNIDVVALYHGGEPFLNKNIFHMIRTFKRMGIRFVKIVTNGTMIKENMVSRLLRSGIDSIEFSLDGNSPAENNKIRRGSSYQLVVSTIKAILIKKEELKLSIPEICIANTQIPTKRIFKDGNITTPGFLKKEFSGFMGKIVFKNTFMIKWPGFILQKWYEMLQRKQDKKSLRDRKSVV